MFSCSASLANSVSYSASFKYKTQQRTIALCKGLTTMLVGAFILIPDGAFPAVKR